MMTDLVLSLPEQGRESEHSFTRQLKSKSSARHWLRPSLHLRTHRLRILLLAASLALGFAGCERHPTLISRDDAIAFRVVAQRDADSAIVAAAMDTAGRFVKRGKDVLAEWVPIDQSALIDAGDIEDAPTRVAKQQTEILVLHTVNDISESEIATIRRASDGAPDGSALVTVTEAGSKMLFPLTVEHVDRMIAVIVDGRVRAVPRIASPVRKQLILSVDTLDKVRVYSVASD